jgi:hypothetical protein
MQRVAPVPDHVGREERSNNMQSTARIVVAAVALLSIAAFGQESTTTTEERSTTTTTDNDTDMIDTDVDYVGPSAAATARTTREDLRPNLITPIGLAVDVGGGVHDFVDRGLNRLADTGGAWEARLTVGTRTFLGGEIAYVGTANPLNNTIGDDIDERAVLVSNGIEGLLRVNAMLDEWQPYAVAGYTYRRFTVQNTDVNTAAVEDGADDHEIPVGVGLAYRFKGLIADARFMVHPSVSSELQPTADTLPTALSLVGKVGFEF